MKEEQFITRQCIGCGYCCKTARCTASVRLNPVETECSQLYWDNYRKLYRCRLMEMPGILGETYRKELYTGGGCCSPLNDWRNNVKNRDTPEEDPIIIDKTFQIFLTFLGRQFISTDIIVLTLLSVKHALIVEGVSKERAEKTVIKCMDYINNNKSTFMNEFIR